MAHALKPWADMYTQKKAGGNYHFAIGNWYHPNGSGLNYYWVNSTTKNYFSTAMTEGVGMWDGMINVKETTVQNAQMSVVYNPNISVDIGAYVNCTVHVDDSDGHYKPQGSIAEMVLGNITGYSKKNKMQVLGHELGHVWGLMDLADITPKLSSIYASPYTYPKATQGDRNGMYICLNTPWYYASGPDRRAKYQKAPGIWAKSETLIIQGKKCTFDAKGYLISSL